MSLPSLTALRSKLTLLKQLSILITDCLLSCLNTKPFGSFTSFESMSNSNEAKKLSIFLFAAFICCSHRAYKESRNISVHLQLRVILLCLFLNRPNAYLANRYRSTFDSDTFMNLPGGGNGINAHCIRFETKVHVCFSLKPDQKCMHLSLSLFLSAQSTFAHCTHLIRLIHRR